MITGGVSECGPPSLLGSREPVSVCTQALGKEGILYEFTPSHANAILSAFEGCGSGSGAENQIRM